MSFKADPSVHADSPPGVLEKCPVCNPPKPTSEAATRMAIEAAQAELAARTGPVSPETTVFVASDSEIVYQDHYRAVVKDRHGNTIEITKK